MSPDSVSDLWPRVSRSVIRLARDTRWQILLASLVGVLVAGIPAIAKGETAYSGLDDRGDYLAFMFGIASILALVASINFGFLLHFLQSVVSERYLIYGRFKDEVRELREFLDAFYEAGVVDEGYEFHFGLIDDVRMDQVPVLDWGDRISPLTEWVEAQEAVIEEDDFGRLLRGYFYRGSDIEELVNLLLINWLRQITMRHNLAPVLKSFATLAVVIFALVVAAVHYSGVLVTVLWGATLALSVMALLLIVELSLVAWRESREVENLSSWVDEDDERADEEPAAH